MKEEPHARRPNSSQKVSSTDRRWSQIAAVALSAGLGCALASPPAALLAADNALPAAASAKGSTANQVAELRRVAAHLHQILAADGAVAASVPMPRLKPLQRDRSDQVVALLARAGPAPAPVGTLPAAAPRAQGADDQDIGAPSPAPSAVMAVDARAPAVTSEAVAELRDELAARDELIANLLQRVEQLERRIVLNASQLDQTVGGAGPVPLLRHPHAETAPPPAAGAAATAAAVTAPVQLAQAQPLVRPEEEAVPPAATSEEAAPPATTEGEAAPTQAPGQFEIDEEAIDRALERTLVQEGVLLLPLGQAEIEPSFTYTRREFDVPTFVTVNGDTFVGEQKLRRNEFVTSAALRVGLPWDSQIEVGIPYNYVDQDVTTTVGGAPQTSNSESGHGFGDVSVGLAKTLLQEGAGWWPDLIGRVTYDADTGKTQDNGVFLGGGFNEVSGSLSAVKRQDPLAFVGSVSYAKTFEHDDIEPGDDVGFSLGTVLAASPETSLSFFFNQNFADDAKVDGDRINGSDQVIGTLSLGAATILGRNVLLSVTGEIGLTDDAPDYAIGASLPIRFDLPTF